MYDVVTNRFALRASRAARSLILFSKHNSKNFIPQTNLIFFFYFHSKYLKNRILKNFFMKIFSETKFYSISFKKFAALLKFISFEFEGPNFCDSPVIADYQKKAACEFPIVSDDDIYSIISINKGVNL
jgi:hypothetical protein